MTANSIVYPVGYRQFHADPTTNYQLNRWLPRAMESEFVSAAQRLHRLADWKPVMLELAATALADQRILHASTYFRAAEFFMDDADPDRARVYDSYVQLFRRAFGAVPHHRHEIEFDGGRLSAVHVPAHGRPRDAFVIH